MCAKLSRVGAFVLGLKSMKMLIKMMVMMRANMPVRHSSRIDVPFED